MLVILVKHALCMSIMEPYDAVPIPPILDTVNSKDTAGLQ
jgi:hypothetical protein